MNNVAILYFLAVVFLICPRNLLSKKFEEGKKPDWAKKDIRDYSEADLERLLDQWEVGQDI